MSNIYPPGQCTWWAADQAPWVMRYGNLGNAKDWAGVWKAHGGGVASTPTDGNVVCFQPGADGADAGTGHVAVVVGSGISDFLVSEMNGPAGPGHTDDRLCQLVPGVSFLVESEPTPPEDDDLTTEQAAQLATLAQQTQDIHDALFKPVQQDGGAGYPAYAQPNNLDIARRAVSPYAKGYPPANPPQEP